MENKKHEIKTVEQFLKETNKSVDDLLKVKIVCLSNDDQLIEDDDNETLSKYENMLKIMADAIARVIKHQNILGAMANFLLSRYHDLAKLHRVDLDLDAIESDKDEMYEEFEKNK